MALAEQLAASRAKLSKSAQPQKTAPSLKDQLQTEAKQKTEMGAIHERVRQADLNFWYSALKPYTYETVFLPLSIEVRQVFGVFCLNACALAGRQGDGCVL